MRKDMKLIGLAVCLTCCTAVVNAQEVPQAQERQQHEQRLTREVPNPEKIATQQTNQMKNSLQLTEKQYKKIYKLNLKEQKERFKAMQGSDEQNRPTGGSGMGGGRPPMGGGQPPMMGEGNFPGAGRRGGGPMMTRESNAADTQKKAAEAKEKKIKKILTKEQYEKWQAEQAEARKQASKRRMHKDSSSNVPPVIGKSNL